MTTFYAPRAKWDRHDGRIPVATWGGQILPREVGRVIDGEVNEASEFDMIAPFMSDIDRSIRDAVRDQCMRDSGTETWAGIEDFAIQATPTPESIDTIDYLAQSVNAALVSLGAAVQVDPSRSAHTLAYAKWFEAAMTTNDFYRQEAGIYNDLAEDDGRQIALPSFEIRTKDQFGDWMMPQPESVPTSTVWYRSGSPALTILHVGNGEGYPILLYPDAGVDFDHLDDDHYLAILRGVVLFVFQAIKATYDIRLVRKTDADRIDDEIRIRRLWGVLSTALSTFIRDLRPRMNTAIDEMKAHKATGSTAPSPIDLEDYGEIAFVEDEDDFPIPSDEPPPPSSRH